MRIDPWPFAAILAVATLARVVATPDPGTTWVLTPMVDVVPGGAPIGAVEAKALHRDVREQVDARDMKLVYATLGSTLSLDDLVRGIESLDAVGAPLSDAQAPKVRALLEATQADHRSMREVQLRILDLEKKLDGGVDATLAALPPDVAEMARQGGPR